MPIINPDEWNGERYYPISQFYKKRFGERVHKISVSVVDSCPNRKGRDGHGCVFCDQWGSAGNHHLSKLSLQEQIKTHRDRLSQRYHVHKFLVYFQSFTNTYTKITQLEENIEIALNEDSVCGIILGTRPDCLPDKVFPILQSLTERTFTSIELGIQSFDNHQLEFLNRGHTAEQSIKAIQDLHTKAQVDVGVHLIFGLPNETTQDIIETAKTINSLPIDNVKLHNLHVLARTPLETLYRKNLFAPISLEEYRNKVILFLEHLSPLIPVHRLAAYAGPHNELVAPDWTRERIRPLQSIKDELKNRKSYQGLHYSLE